MARKSRKNEDMKSMKAATKLAPPPLDVKASMIDDMMDPTSRSVLLKRLVSSGSPYSRNELMNMVTNQLTVNHQRRFFYRECEQAMTHPYVIGACELLTDTVSAFSSTHNRSVWVTSKDKRKSNVANQLLMELGVEEKIRDWAGQLAQYGDLFIKMFGRKGTGVVYLDDRIHPADMERVDINGRLEGFVRTGYYSGHASFNAELEAPWAYVHGRVYGSQYRIQNAVLGMFGEPGMRYQFLEDPEAKFRITTKYGTSILAPAVPVYKRLKLAEDAVLMARVTRGIMWYLYKIKTASGSFRQAAAKAEEYAEVLKRTTGLNISQNEWKDRFEPIFAQVEDLYVPENGDVTVDAQEYGGKNADIKGVVDVEMLENRLLGSLRVSKAMLGVTDSLPGSIGEGAAQRISINFAKNAYRLQTGLRSMLARMVQVHFAYLGIDPDPSGFEVNLAQINGAEEEELKNALKSGLDICTSTRTLMKEAFGDRLDEEKLFEVFNKSILKIPELNLADLLKKEEAPALAMGPDGQPQDQLVPGAEPVVPLPRESISTDLLSYVPYQGTSRTYAINESRKPHVVAREWKPVSIKFKASKDMMELQKKMQAVASGKVQAGIGV